MPTNFGTSAQPTYLPRSKSGGSAFNTGSSTSGGSSSGGSSSYNKSQSSSFQNSEANSDSASGAQWSPEQLGRINALYPQLLKDYGSYGTATPFASLLSQIGGPNTEFGKITTGPIWNQNQIQGQVNQMRAGNDAATAGQALKLADSTAGKGFGVNSPLYQELVGNAQGMNRATNTGAENDLRFNAAQGNAQHLLATQQADVQRSGEVSRDDLARRQMALGGRGQDLQYAANRQNALLQALGYYNQPLAFAKSKSSQKSSGGSRSTSESGSNSFQTSNNFGTSNNSGGSSNFSLSDYF